MGHRSLYSSRLDLLFGCQGKTQPKAKDLPLTFLFIPHYSWSLEMRYPLG
jgi:hypothetical protein